MSDVLLVISYGKLTFWLYPDAFCTGSVEPAFHVRETGGSFGTAPALQNRLPPLGSDPHSSALCQPSWGALPLCVSSAHCAPGRKSLFLCVVAVRGESSRFSNPRYSCVSSHELSGITFSPGPVCSTKKDLNSVPDNLNTYRVI